MTKKQQEVLRRELSKIGKSDKLEDYNVVMTDSDTSQFHVKLKEEAYVFTQADTIHPETGVFGDFRAEYGKFSSYSKDELERFISGYYSSLDQLKEEAPDNWKMIALECGFEQDLL